MYLFRVLLVLFLIGLYPQDKFYSYDYQQPEEEQEEESEELAA